SVAPLPDMIGQLLARQRLAALIEGDHEESGPRLRKGRQQELALARHQLGRRHLAVLLDLLERHRPAQATGILLEPVALRTVLPLADGDDGDAHGRTLTSRAHANKIGSRLYAKMFHVKHRADPRTRESAKQPHALKNRPCFSMVRPCRDSITQRPPQRTPLCDL